MDDFLRRSQSDDPSVWLGEEYAEDTQNQSGHGTRAPQGIE
jgi:hypothetical protein